MKILIMAFNQIENYNWGHELFRREMARCEDVVFFGPGYTPKGIGLFDFLKTIKMSIYDFDFIFTHGLKYTMKIKDIYDIPKDVCKVHYVIDYFLPKGEFKGRSKEQHAFLNSYKPDIVFSVYHDSIKSLSENIKCDNIFNLPFSACTKTYTNIKYRKLNTVATCFSRRKDAYPDRSVALKYLVKNKIPILDRQTNIKYVKAINKCKVTLGVNDIYRSLNMRVTEILSCGGFFLTNKPKYIEKLGMISGEHYMTYDSFDDMIDKIRYYFGNDNQRKRIEEKGMTLVRENHSCEKRIHEMIDMIKKVKG